MNQRWCVLNAPSFFVYTFQLANMNHLKKYLLVFLVCASLNTPSMAAEFTVNLANEWFIHNPSLPILALDNGLYGKFKIDKFSTEFRQNSINISYKRISVSYSKQFASFLHFSKDTAELAYVLSKKQNLETTRVYDIAFDYQFYSFKASRLSALVLQTQTTSVELGASYLQGESLINGQLSGGIRALSTSDLQFENLLVDYYYSSDQIFTRSVVAPNGTGKAFDFDWMWHIDRLTTFHLSGRNIFSSIIWKQSPHTRAMLRSDNKTYDENGYVDIQPGLSGRHDYVDYEQVLPAQFFARFDFRGQAAKPVFMQWHYINQIAYPSIGIEYFSNHRLSMEAQFDIKSRALGLLVDTKYVDLYVASDHINPKHSRFFVLRFILSILNY